MEIKTKVYLSIGTIIILSIVGAITYEIPQELAGNYSFYECNTDEPWGMLCWKLSGGKHTWCYDNISSTSHITCSVGWDLRNDTIKGKEVQVHPDLFKFYKNDNITLEQIKENPHSDWGKPISILYGDGSIERVIIYEEWYR